LLLPTALDLLGRRDLLCGVFVLLVVVVVIVDVVESGLVENVLWVELLWFPLFCGCGLVVLFSLGRRVVGDLLVRLYSWLGIDYLLPDHLFLMFFVIALHLFHLSFYIRFLWIIYHLLNRHFLNLPLSR